MMARKAFVDRDICVGCSVCSTECSEVFYVKQDSEHEGAFKSFTNDNVEQEPLTEKIDIAIKMCPVQCISWMEKAAKEQK